MRFVAIDVETANADMASICSIGAATFEDGKAVAEWYSLVDPHDEFDGINISIHGIDENMVAGAPTYAEIAGTLDGIAQGTVVVTHTYFDRIAMCQASDRWSVAPPVCSWLDSAMVTRRTWMECAARGYGLADICKRIGYKFQHHNALEDAKAAGYVILAAMAESGLDLDGFLARVKHPIGGADGGIKIAGNSEGPLHGEVIVFTGALEIPRREAATLAASVGCNVDVSVTKNTTIVVVGDTDIKRLAGYEKSSKQRKAEELARKGNPIRIIRETDFRKLVSLQ